MSIIEEYTNIIKLVLEEFKDNNSVLEKIDTIIKTIPKNMDLYNKSLIEKEEKIAQLKKDKLEFKEEFLKTNPYFYVSTMSRFFYYDGLHYTIINEDDIQYNLFTCLSENKNLHTVKYKTQSETIKEIKNTRTILDTIPESETISFVTNSLCPLLFTNKSNLKYFMIVVGNHILKQHETYIHFINKNCKSIMSFIEKSVMDTVGINISDNFKIKYHHNHELKKCRLVKMNTSLENNDSFCNFFKNYCPDFISVCCYYSKRYKTEDVYLSRMTNNNSKNYILYLESNTIISIVKKFRNNIFIMGSVDDKISSKYMNFIWRWYVNNENIPNILSMGTLKDQLTKLLPYDEKNDVYTHVECNFLKSINDFVDFCNENIIEDKDEIDVSEVIDIYRVEYPKNETIEENTFDMLLKNNIISYFMRSNKTILSVSCKFWNKSEEVKESIKEYKELLDKEQNPLKCYDAYEYYVSKNYKYIANKMYFERFFYNMI